MQRSNNENRTPLWSMTVPIERRTQMRFLVLKAYVKLVLFDLYLARGNFNVLYEKVKRCPLAKREPSTDAVKHVCAAVDMACIWYWKKVLCLQRSAATACLLKQHGVIAEMVIGSQQVPFEMHAWVEVDGRVVNDKPYVREMYRIVDCL